MNKIFFHVGITLDGYLAGPKSRKFKIENRVAALFSIFDFWILDFAYPQFR